MLSRVTAKIIGDVFLRHTVCMWYKEIMLCQSLMWRFPLISAESLPTADW